MTRDPQSGFSLIETLVALAVLAVSSIAFLGATQAHIARIGALEYRAAARLAAQNYLAEVTLHLPPTGQEALLGIPFDIFATDSATADPDLRRLDISAANQGTVYARLTGFVQNDGGQGQ